MKTDSFFPDFGRRPGMSLGASSCGPDAQWATVPPDLVPLLCALPGRGRTLPSLRQSGEAFTRQPHTQVRAGQRSQRASGKLPQLDP